MTGRRTVLARSEDGQSLVFVVFALFGLVLVLALVVDVGMWLRAHRHAQAVADAAALAAAQELPDVDEAIAARNLYRDLNWPEANVDDSPPPSDDEIEVRVVVSDVPGIFSPLVGLFDVEIAAEARAKVEVPTTVTALAPLALRCTRVAGVCSPWSIVSGEEVSFDYSEPPDDDASTFFPLALQGVSFDELGPYLSCDPEEPGPDCYAGELGWADVYKPDRDELEAMLASASPGKRLVAVFDDHDDAEGTVNIVGWAAFTITSVGPPGNGNGNGKPPVRLRGTFSRLLVPGTSVSSAGGGAPYDFGVRAVALTG